jgi:hypothetical protein
MLGLGLGLARQKLPGVGAISYADPPAAFVATSYPTVNGTTINLSSGGDIQGAIDTLRALDGNLNHEIVLAAGGTYTGNYRLRPRTGANASGTGWIVIRSNGTLPASGTRAMATDSAQMAKLVSPGQDATTGGHGAIIAEASSRHYRMVGLEVTHNDNTFPSSHVDCLVMFGWSTGGQTTANMPHHMILDRCYVHGQGTTNNVKRGVSLDGMHIGVIDSTILDIRSGSWTDCVGVWGTNGWGPIKVDNCHIEASGECLGLGGDVPTITNLITEDVTFTRNYLSKPTSWKGSYICKNLFELKQGRRVLFEGNILDGNWDDGRQQYYAIVLKSVNQNPGTATWTVTEHVTIRKNHMKNVVGALSLNARPQDPNYNVYSLANFYAALPMNHINIENNLFEVGAYNGTAWGWFLHFAEDLSGVRFANNTFVHKDNTASGTGPTRLWTADTYSNDMAGLIFINNVATMGDNGLTVRVWDDANAKGKAGGQADGAILSGNTAIDYQWSTFQFEGNVLVRDAGDFPLGSQPANNVKAASVAAVSFTNTATSDYSLSGASPYLTSGLSNARPGVDMTALTAAITGVRPVLPPDTTPDAFSFTAVSGVALSSTNTSNTVTPTGFDTATTISAITGGTYSLNGGAFSSTVPVAFSPGDTIAVRGTASSSNLTVTSVSVTIGGVTGSYSITTVSGSSATLQTATWENLTGMTDNGSGTLTAPSGGAYYSYASTVQKVQSGDGYFEFTYTGSRVACALDTGTVTAPNNSNPTANQQFGVAISGTTMLTWLNGTNVGASVTVATSDVIRIAIESGVCVVKKNGSTVYTFTGGGTTLAYPYYGWCHVQKDSPPYTITGTKMFA